MFVWLNITVSLLCGCILGLLTVKLMALVTPSAGAAPQDPAAADAHVTAA